ncbi:hypothetical protein [Streptomyces cyaneochromogenes]|uniref:hypothetical protein n=1 Tax=Streptomyces cyaneochromogenes TaxID=2496836 RepID=UPI0015884D8C|nr:hypothetical protein [Streptomyces cyaneochromogenes]
MFRATRSGKDLRFGQLTSEFLRGKGVVSGFQGNEQAFPIGAGRAEVHRPPGDAMRAESGHAQLPNGQQEAPRLALQALSTGFRGHGRPKYLSFV